MQINVSQQLKASIGTVRYYDLDEIVDIVDNSGSRVQGRVSLTKTNEGILAKANLSTEVNLTCSRCLKLFSYSLLLDFEEEYFPTMDIISGMSLSLPDEPGTFTIDECNVLDLTEAVRQYGILAIPMKPLCHEDCTGIEIDSGKHKS